MASKPMASLLWRDDGLPRMGDSEGDERIPINRSVELVDYGANRANPLLSNGIAAVRIGASISTTDPKAAKRKTYVFLCILYAVYGISSSLLAPALPSLLLELTEGDTSRSSMLYGSVTSMRFLLEFFSAPFLGSLADSRGRKVVFMLAIFVCGLEFALLSMSPTLPMIFFTRAMSGLGDAGVAAGYAMMTDLALHNEDMVSQQYALLGAMSGVAVAIGPLIGGQLIAKSTRLCFLTACLIACVGLLGAYVGLEETRDLHYHNKLYDEDEDFHQAAVTEKKSTTTTCWSWIVRADKIFQECNPWEGLRNHWRNPALRALLPSLSICALNLGVGYIMFMFLHIRFQASTQLIGLFISFHGLLNALAQGVGIRLLVPNVFSERSVALVGLLFVALHTLLNGFCRTWFQIATVAIVLALTAIQYPALKAVIVCEALECHREGKQYLANLQGAISSVRTISVAMGSMLFNWLLARGMSPSTHKELVLSWGNVELLGGTLPFVVAFVLYLMAFMWLSSGLRSVDMFKSKEIQCMMEAAELEIDLERESLNPQTDSHSPWKRNESQELKLDFSLSGQELAALHSPKQTTPDGILL